LETSGQRLVPDDTRSLSGKSRFDFPEASRSAKAPPFHIKNTYGAAEAAPFKTIFTLSHQRGSAKSEAYNGRLRNEV